MATPPTLTTRARAHLRSLAHHLEPVVQLGADGVSEALVEAAATALAQHELIKVRIGSNAKGGRQQIARELAAATGADLTQVIGRIVVLYRPRAASDKRPRIVLPA